MHARTLPLLLLFLAATALSADWPQFRGPGARGVLDGAGQPSSWSREANVLWSVEIPGRGWSSPIITGELVVLTSAESAGPVPEAKKGLYFGGNRKKPFEHEHTWTVHCLDKRSGKPRWRRVAHTARPKTPLHIKNSHASETPVTDGKRVFAYFGNVGVFAYDLEGKALWSKRLDPHPTRYGWGTAASPALHDGVLYIVNDNEKSSYLLALDTDTGSERFRIERDEKSNWATPFVWSHDGGVELVTPGTGRVRSYALDGSIKWELRGMSSITIPTPFEAHGLLFFGSGYVLDPMRPIYAVRPGAKGDISLAENETSSAHIAWRDDKAGPYNPSFLVYRDLLYVLYDRGFLGCYEAKTGKPIYRKRRLEQGEVSGGAFTASPWAADGKVYCLSENGDTFVVKAGRDFEILGVNSLDALCMATPALDGERLYIRTLEKLYCIAAAKRAKPEKKAE